MIEKVELLNFQAHRKLVIDLAPITSIVGPSDVGKSSIIRALYWLAFNRPAGTSYRRHNTSTMSVSVTVDGIKVKRVRGKSNRYVVAGEKLQAFATGVPPQVSNALQLQSTNFQLQHDAPFWFSETSGQVSKELNKIASLEDMDRIMSYLSSKLRQTDAEIRVVENRLQQTRQTAKSLRWAVEAEKDMAEISEIVAIRATTADKLSSLLAAIRKVSGAKEEQKNAANAHVGCVRIGKTAETIRGLRYRLHQLRSLLRLVQIEENMTCDLKTALKSLHNKVRQSGTRRCPTCGQVLLTK